MIKKRLIAGNRRWWAAGMALLLAGAAVAGCSSSGGVSSDSAGALSDAQAPMYDESGGSADNESGAAGGSAGYDMSADESWDADSGGSDDSWAPEIPAPDTSGDRDLATGEGSTDVSGGPVTANRQIIRTADVTITVPVDPDEGEKNPSREKLADAASDAARAVRALVTLPGGYVAGSDGSGSAITVTLRIPAGSYDSVMDRLGKIGKVTERYEATVDVTGEMIDVKSRIKSQQASVDRLRALMTEADSMTDVIAIESELSRREADLDSLLQRQAGLADQVALSTISVTVNAVPAASPELEEPPVERSAFMRGLIAGWDAIASVGRGIAAVVGAVLPFLPIIAVIAIAGMWIARRRRHSPSPQPPADPAVQPTVESSVDPATQPATEPATQPTTEPAAPPVGDNENHHDISQPNPAGDSDSTS